MDEQTTNERFLPDFGAVLAGAQLTLAVVLGTLWMAGQGLARWWSPS